jgi:hypothetical protein
MIGTMVEGTGMPQYAKIQEPEILKRQHLKCSAKTYKRKYFRLGINEG